MCSTMHGTTDACFCYGSLIELLDNKWLYNYSIVNSQPVKAWAAKTLRT